MYAEAVGRRAEGGEREIQEFSFYFSGNVLQGFCCVFETIRKINSPFSFFILILFSHEYKTGNVKDNIQRSYIDLSIIALPFCRNERAQGERGRSISTFLLSFRISSSQLFAQHSFCLFLIPIRLLFAMLSSNRPECCCNCEIGFSNSMQVNFMYSSGRGGKGKSTHFNGKAVLQQGAKDTLFVSHFYLFRWTNQFIIYFSICSVYLSYECFIYELREQMEQHSRRELSNSASHTPHRPLTDAGGGGDPERGLQFVLW